MNLNSSQQTPATGKSLRRLRHAFPATVCGRRWAAAILAGTSLVLPVSGDPDVTATQKDSFPDPDGDNKAEPGQVITYETIIANGGNMAAQNLRLNSPTPLNTVFDPASVKSTPLARDDVFNSIGNVGLSVADPGVLSNDFDLGPTVPTVVAGSGATALGGSVTINAGGGFTYTPPAGFSGSDTFTYTIKDEGPVNLPPPATGSNVATVTVSVQGMIWFIDDSAGAGGDGSLANPFDTLSDHDNNPNDSNGDGIFLYSGTYSGGITLEDGQKLVGQGAGTSLDAALGISLPSGSLPLPSTGGSRPLLSNASGHGINLGSGNTIRGLEIGNTPISSDGINGGSVGSLTIDEVAISGTGGGVDLSNGALSVTFDSISSFGSDHGIRLSNTSGSFTVTGDGSTPQSGGLIQNATDDGISLTNAQGIDLSFVRIENSGAHGIDILNVTDFQFKNSTIHDGSNSTNPAGPDANDDGIHIRNLFGQSLIQDVDITAIAERGIEVVSDARDDALPDELSVRRVTFANLTSGIGENMFQYTPRGTGGSASLTRLLVEDCSAVMDANGAGAFFFVPQQNATAEIIVRDCVLDATNAFGSGNLRLSASDTATLRGQVDNVTIINPQFFGLELRSDGSADTHITATNNMITNVTNFETDHGMEIKQDENSVARIDASGNSVDARVEFRAINVSSQDGASPAATLDLILGNNDFAEPDTPNFASGIILESGTFGGGSAHQNLLRARVTGNTGTVAGGFAGFLGFGEGIGLAERGNTQFQLEQGGSASTDPLVVLAANNGGIVNTMANSNDTFTQDNSDDPGSDGGVAVIGNGAVQSPVLPVSPSL